MKILIDTNVVLDVLANRPDFVEHSEAVLILAARHKIAAAIMANTVTDIAYLLRKHLPDREAIKASLIALMDLLEVVEVTKEKCVRALGLPMSDYEDALLALCAKKWDAEFIVTRNVRDFSGSPVRAVTPEDFLKEYASE